MRRGRRIVNHKTVAQRQRAFRNYRAAMNALDAGATLRLSSKTNVEAGTVHAGLGHSLVKRGSAQYVEGDLTRIVERDRG